MKPFCIALIVAALFLQMTGCSKQRTPEELFREAVMERIPPSAQIINASLSNTNIWIHFKISPEDYQSLWKSEAFVVFEAKEHVNFINKVHTSPDWWNPVLLGDEQICLECEVAPHSGFDRSVKTMFVNQQRTEVFFVLINWYNY